MNVFVGGSLRESLRGASAHKSRTTQRRFLIIGSVARHVIYICRGACLVRRESIHGDILGCTLLVSMLQGHCKQGSAKQATVIALCLCQSLEAQL